MQRIVTNVIGMLVAWLVWIWLAGARLPMAVYMWIAAGGTLVAVPVVLVGRWLLDREPTIERAEEVTTWVHYLFGILLGSSILSATVFALSGPGPSAGALPWLGLGLMFLSSLVLLAVVLNLALKGLGAPFAVALTREVATEWLYAWTRNPMISAAVVLLLGLGLWLQSGLFLVWLVVFIGPAFVVFVKVYEERELEIRFGQSYLDYKARTPAFFPRRPR